MDCQTTLKPFGGHNVLIQYRTDYNHVGHHDSLGKQVEKCQNDPLTSSDIVFTGSDGGSYTG